MMADFLLELLSEEIPARMQAKAASDLAKLFSDKIAEAGLRAGALEMLVTPRRLTLIARDLPLETEAVREERKGPRADAPEQALAGFLRSTGLSREQLEERDDGKGGKVLFAVIERPGRKTPDVLAEAIPAIIRAFPWPKSMRWGRASQTTESLRWVRPLQGVVAILGNDLVEFEVDGLSSCFETVGHRFHHTGPITIGNADDYAMKLRAAHVIVDPAERQAIIREAAKKLAADKGLVWIEDEALVAENAGLTEWPVPLIGDFDPAFLELPREVIQLTLATNQKYFVCADKAGALAPAFICTANIEAKDGGAAIVAGNLKVLAARLSDARFFWEQDQKTSLADHAKKLERITFHEKLGTVADKVERVAKLARWLVEEGAVKGADPAMAEQAARLAKADLVTEMVGEFPELQGVMGGYYAAKEGLPQQVSDAIRDHYKPVGQGDDVPTAPVTVAVALADKLDTIGAFFRIEEFPTGSKDPFALRRAAFGVLKLVTENDLRFHMRIAVDQAASNLENQQQIEALGMGNARGYGFGGGRNGLPVFILEFFADRLKVQQKEAGVRHDLIDAVFALGGEDDLVRLLARVKALQGFIGTDDGVNLLSGYKRAANLLKQADGAPAQAGAQSGEGSQGHGLVQAEQELVAALDTAEPKAQAAVEAEDFEGAMAALASLRAPIDAFFEGVMVNDPDPAVRAFRLGLLARVRDAVHRVADFSKIEG